MKTRKEKQKDLEALTEQFQNANSALIIGFNKLTVDKDQELRDRLREIGAQYKVVKNTIATKAIAGTSFEQATEHFTGMTGIAFHEKDPVTLSKTLSKIVKDNGEVFSFKVGVVEGRVVDLKGVEAIANLPSREALISQLMFLVNANAQRLATVINAVPRNLAIVINQIGDQKSETA
jgi:large subunit ribosomal protein L10